MCAPSNVAVDGILERLVAAEAGSGSGGGGGGRKSGDRLRVARMGHPARLLPQVGMGGREEARALFVGRLLCHSWFSPLVVRDKRQEVRGYG